MVLTKLHSVQNGLTSL